MTKKLALLMAFMALGLSACDNKSTTETTEKSEVGGTTIERQTTTETTTNSDGTSQETKTETTVDPQGLMNKETTEHESSTTQESH